MTSLLQKCSVWNGPPHLPLHANNLKAEKFLANLSVSLGGKGDFIRNVWLTYTGTGPRDGARPRAQNKSEEPTVQDRT